MTDTMRNPSTPTARNTRKPRGHRHHRPPLRSSPHPMVGRNFRPTMGWGLERSGGRWWRWPLGFLVFLAVGVLGFLIVSVIAAVARRVGTDEGPLTAIVWAGAVVTLAVAVYVGVKVARPPLQW